MVPVGGELPRRPFSPAVESILRLRAAGPQRILTSGFLHKIVDGLTE